MTRTITLITMLLLGIALAIAVGGTTDDSIPDSKYIEYAKGFAPYTVAVAASGTGAAPHMGTATLISDRWAITAAHIVSGASTVKVGERKAVEVVVHPEYSEDCVGCFDVALVRVDESFGRDYYPPLSTGDENPGDLCSIAGYGLHGPMSSGYSSSDGRLRAGTARIDRFDGTRIICPISRGSSPLPYGISPGDSGGPLFCNGKLAGINSFTMRDKGFSLKSRVGEEQGFARVSVMRDWIDEVMRGE